MTSHLPSPPSSDSPSISKDATVVPSSPHRERAPLAPFHRHSPVSQPSSKLLNFPFNHNLILSSSDSSSSAPKPTKLAFAPFRPLAPPRPSSHELEFLRSSSEPGSSSPLSSPVKAPQAAARSAAGNSTPTGKSVSWSATHLPSVHSSPRHAASALLSNRHISLRTPISLYSAPTPKLFPSPISASSPLKRTDAPRVNSLQESLLYSDDDTSTDDEAEDEEVYSLLVSAPESPSLHFGSFSTPFTPFAFPSPAESTTSSVPRSILKAVAAPILKTISAKEGSRRNSGRRKHALGWTDQDAAVMGRGDQVVMEVSALSGGKAHPGKMSNLVSSEVGGGSNGQSAGAAAGGAKRSSPSKQPMSNGTGGGGGRGGSGGGGGGGDNPKGGPPSTTVPLAKTPHPLPDEDPSLFLTPLRTLKASLRPASHPFIRPSSDPSEPPALLPRPGPPSPSRHSPLHVAMRGVRPSVDLAMDLDGDGSADEDNAYIQSGGVVIPAILSDVEAAYLALIRAMIRLPTTLASEQTTLKPLRKYRNCLLSCITREIANIISFPSSFPRPPPSIPSPPAVRARSRFSAPGDLSSPPAERQLPRKVGLPEEQMCRQKDEVGAATAAIKCVTALCKAPRLSSLYSRWSFFSVSFLYFQSYCTHVRIKQSIRYRDLEFDIKNSLLSRRPRTYRSRRKRTLSLRPLVPPHASSSAHSSGPSPQTYNNCSSNQPENQRQTSIESSRECLRHQKSPTDSPSGDARALENLVYTIGRWPVGCAEKRHGSSIARRCNIRGGRQCFETAMGCQRSGSGTVTS